MFQSKATQLGKRFIGVALAAALVLSPSAALALTNAEQPEQTATLLSLHLNQMPVQNLFS